MCKTEEYSELCDVTKEEGVLAHWGVCVEKANNGEGTIKDCVEVYEGDLKKYFGD